MSTTTIDRSAKKQTQTIDYPDSDTNAESVNINGLLVSSVSKTGLTYAYDYDALGRRTRATDPRTGTAVTHYNADHRVDYVQDAADNRTGFAHDPVNGQKTSETNADNKVTRYAYNARGQVTQTWGQAAYPVEYVFDDYGRMTAMRTYRSGTAWSSDAWTPTSTVLFVYDGWNLIQELDGTQPTPTVQKSYAWGLDLSQSLQGAGGVGGLLAALDASGSYLFCHDANGNVGQMVNAASGAIAAAYEYDPFGKTIRSSGDMANANPFRFSTKYHDTETGLYYYGYRYYEAEMGRWLSRDPIEELGFKVPNENSGTGDDSNLYLFVFNAPINYLDPNGLWIWAEWQKCKSTEKWAKKSNGIIPKTDGCSFPKILEWILPKGGGRNDPTGQYKNLFLNPCNFHDYCYSDCTQTHFDCDYNFHKKMKTACDSAAKVLFKYQFQIHRRDKF